MSVSVACMHSPLRVRAQLFLNGVYARRSHAALQGRLFMGFADWLGLAATTFVAALLYAVSGFGFAVLAAPLYLLFTAPAQAVQLVIIISTALAIIVLPGLRRSVAPMLLLR